MESVERDLDALRGWHCRGLRTAVRVDGVLNGGPVSRGWDVEIAIPMRQLAPHPPPAPGVEWRFNAYRIDRSARGDELQAFSPIGRPDFHVPDRFGLLEFTIASPVDDVAQRRRRETYRCRISMKPQPQSTVDR